MYIVISNILLSIAIVFLLGGGIYFSIKLSFPQLQWKKIFSSLKTKSSYISPLKSLLMSLAARIGVGAVAGVALAIYIGGPGTILWIWIISLITVINSFVENYLGLKYQNKEEVK